jgi:hypothetical protein
VISLQSTTSSFVTRNELENFNVVQRRASKAAI